MNFDPVGYTTEGEMYMKFHKPYTPVEKIQLLQRSILVNSFAYYELNENILADHDYDANARQLEDLSKQYPDEFARSRYYGSFHDFFGDDGVHMTSGYDLLERVRKKNKDLYRRLWMDAANALHLKQMRGVGV